MKKSFKEINAIYKNLLEQQTRLNETDQLRQDELNLAIAESADAKKYCDKCETDFVLGRIDEPSLMNSRARVEQSNARLQRAREAVEISKMARTELGEELIMISTERDGALLELREEQSDLALKPLVKDRKFREIITKAFAATLIGKGDILEDGYITIQNQYWERFSANAFTPPSSQEIKSALAEFDSLLAN